MITCSKCYGNDMEMLAWVDVVTHEVLSQQDEYYCRSCQAKVDIIVTAESLTWIEDIEEIKEISADLNEKIDKSVDDIST